MTEQPSLLDWTPRFHGETFDSERDHARLCAQAKRVLTAVSDGLWHTLHSLSQITGDPEASVSARLRTLRSEGFTVREAARQKRTVGVQSAEGGGVSVLSTAQRIVGSTHPNREKDDFYPTPPEATRALLAHERFDGPVWECACGDGAISKVLAGRGIETVSTDLVDRGFGEAGVDFLMEWQPRAPNIITNPPFKLLVPFIRHALHLTTGKVAILGRLNMLEGKERLLLYRTTPVARVYVFSWRLPFTRGGVDAGLGGNGLMSFCWCVWEHGYTGTPALHWLDEVDDDYGPRRERPSRLRGSDRGVSRASSPAIHHPIPNPKQRRGRVGA